MSLALWILKWLRIVDEFDGEEDNFLFKWEIGVDKFDDDDVFVVVVVVDDNGILDGTGFFNEIEVNDDGLTSESIQIKTTCQNSCSFFY